MLSAKRTRKTARKTSETFQSSTDAATDVSLAPLAAREVPDSLQEETRVIPVAALLDGVPMHMQSRRRLSISPEADETQQ